MPTSSSRISRSGCIAPSSEVRAVKLDAVRLRRTLALAAGTLAACASIALLRPQQLTHETGRALEFVDRSGLPLGTVLSRDGSHAVRVPLERISPDFVRAVLATEDGRFFRHGAVDPAATLRAFAEALGARRAPSGASTIAMQLARLLYPVRSGPAGQAVEAVIAARLENAESKRRILEAYCNRVPMGSNVYGVEAAALTYFGVHAADLDLAQASLLAALPNAPSQLDPYRHWSGLKRRQRVVLARMVAAGDVASDEAKRAALETLSLRERGAGIVAAAHLLFRLAAGAPEGASVVRTTVDRPLQQFLEEQLRVVVETLATNDVRDAAALVVDNRNGEVLAYAGSPDYFSDVALGRNDGVTALRQPGSALKPFLYELALERRDIRPNSILLDAPVAYAIPGGRLYQPSDYDDRFLGPVRVRIALANSLNVPAVRVLERVGVPEFLDRLHTLGFSHLQRPADFYGLGLTLGGGEVTLEELTRAYVALARGGNRLRLRTLLDEPAVPDARPPARDPAWSLVEDVLADRHARAAAFGVDSVLALPFAAAVKTGTSSDFRDTWTVGFTPDYTVGVWVGNFDGAPMHHVSGVTGAGPLWNRIMLHLYERSEPPPFAPPAGYSRVAICATTGLRPTRGCSVVAQEWLDRSDRHDLARAPSEARPASRFGIVFPHDGDRFALFANGGAQRIDIVLDGAAQAAAVSVDGHPLRGESGVFPWNLRLGAHTIAARSAASVVRVGIVVERPPHPSREAFSVVRR